MHSRSRAWVMMLVLLAGPARAEATPEVVASILPIHSLVAAVMRGVGTPSLLVPAGASAHSFSLRPSDARSLARADLIVWVGPVLEGFLVKPLQALASDTPRLTLSEQSSLQHLPARAGGHHGDCESAHATPGGIDPHLWLSPANARAIVSLVATRLARLDTRHAERYRANAQATRARLAELEAQLTARLAPVGRTPFVVFHDAYQYFEAAFELNSIGSLTVDPAIKPGAQRVSALRERIQSSRARCVFSEPQATPALIATLMEDTAARHAAVDPLGVDIPPGPQAYFELLERAADSFAECLGR